MLVQMESVPGTKRNNGNMERCEQEALGGGKGLGTDVDHVALELDGEKGEKRECERIIEEGGGVDMLGSIWR
jgi:hypothetical protein